MEDMYIEKFKAHMDEKDVKYIDCSENSVKLIFGGDNLEHIEINVIFDKDGDNKVAFICWSIGSFKDKVAKGLVTCNEMNMKYRWVKFYLDEEKDITVQADAVVDLETVGDECLELVLRTMNIVDEAYPAFMRAKFGD